MSTILLSFEPEWFHMLEKGIKKFEYRKHFPRDKTTAYFYVSSPEKVITGVASFGARERLTDWLVKYSDRPQNVKERIADFSMDCNWAVPVLSFQKTTAISLDQLRNDLPGFVVPRMYYYIDGTDLHKYLLANLQAVSPLLINSFTVVSDDEIC